MTDIIAKETNTALASYVNIKPVERILSSAIGAILFANGLAGKKSNKIPSIVAGALLLTRGITGFSYLYKALGKERLPRVSKNINIRTSLTINKPRNEVFAFWRKLENLPLFLSHLKSVDTIDDRYSVWKAHIPGQPITIDWTAEIVKEDENSFIGWSSIPDSAIYNAGKITFSDAHDGLATLLDVTISYHPPLGVIGSGVAHLLNGAFEHMVHNDIQNFKIFMETGRLPLK